MKGTLCVYYTRSNHTKEVAEYISKKLNCELLEITDGENRDGFKGYMKSIFDIFEKDTPKLKSFGTGKKMEDYRNVIICSPIWCSTISTITHSFLISFGKKIKGKVYFVTTHDSKKYYNKKINKLNAYLNNNYVSYLSLCNKNDNNVLIDTFIKTIK